MVHGCTTLNEQPSNLKPMINTPWFSKSSITKRKYFFSVPIQFSNIYAAGGPAEPAGKPSHHPHHHTFSISSPISHTNPVKGYYALFIHKISFVFSSFSPKIGAHMLSSHCIILPVKKYHINDQIIYTESVLYICFSYAHAFKIYQIIP